MHMKIGGWKHSHLNTGVYPVWLGKHSCTMNIKMTWNLIRCPTVSGTTLGLLCVIHLCKLLWEKSQTAFPSMIMILNSDQMASCWEDVIDQSRLQSTHIYMFLQKLNKNQNNTYLFKQFVTCMKGEKAKTHIQTCHPGKGAKSKRCMNDNEGDPGAQ